MAVLDAVLQMDESRAVPILKRVLAQRDTASACLRRKAVFILSQHDDHPETPRLLVDAVRNDPDAEVREQAVFWLSQVDSREAVAALDSILRTSRDQGVQEKAVFALSQHDSPAAAQALRAFARRTDVPQSVRENTIFWLSQNDDPQNAAFLRELYGQVADAATKERILFAMSQVEGRETQKWLLGVAGDRGEGVELRKKALFWASQAEGDTPEFYTLYETFTDREMKEHLIFVYSQKDSRAARDKLMAIVRTEKDKELRKKAIFWLGQSDDPRVVEFLSSLLDKPGT
jgi:HEAT repeat protein